METNTIKVESGIQLLLRLTAKKTNLENVYPNLFESSPKAGHVIEIFGNKSSSFLLIDMICEALLPINLGGAEAGVLIINTDGHISQPALTTVLLEKLNSKTTLNSSSKNTENTQMVKEILDNLYIMEIFDAAQLYTTLQNLENIFFKHSNISLCIIDTLTAFYWSEQSFKMTKMDSYLKNLLRIVQKAAKGHDIIILYTRPEYFKSSKDLIENLEACCEHPSAERVNCRIQLLFNDDETCTARVKQFQSETIKSFRTENNAIVWL